MVKKLLTIALGLLCVGGLKAQTVTDATIPLQDIQYWVGSGSDSAVLIVNFGIPDTAFAWGYLFNGTATVQQMTDALSAADPRLTVVGQPSLYPEGDIFFVLDNGDTLSLSGRNADNPWNYWEANINGGVSYTGAAQTLVNGDVFKYGDQRAPSRVCVEYYETWCLQSAWPKVPTPVSVPSAAPVVDATIAAEDILFWVGDGSNQAIFVVNWADTALAWGYRFASDSVTLQTMMDDIAAADSRFSYTGTGMVNDINYTENGTTYGITAGNWWSHLINGYESNGMGQWFHNGDFSRWADPAAGVLVDSVYIPAWDWTSYIYAYPMTIHPVSVPAASQPEEATIAATEIEYWVGEGTNEAIMVVNWADTALAWGYRWNNDATVATMMDDVAAADPRFSYTMNGSYLGDILFVVAAGDTLRGTSWWECSLYNGMAQTLVNGDLAKWADPVAGVVVDSVYYDNWGWSYIYVYPMPIHAVTQPLGAGPFDGIVGTPGCAAIPANDPNILGWATACTLELGPQNISIEGSPLVSYRTAEEAIGPCSMTDNLSVVSLGDGGSATLTFEHPIKNGVGPDFAVYENSFDDYFLELAFVEVSSDGQRFVRFPATSLTQTARQLAGNVDATYINNLAGKYRSGYGTPFDLAELADSTGLDINNITHVRIVDVVGSINPLYATYDAFGHMVNDPWPTNSYSSGYDLDGVAVLHSTSEGIDEVGNEMVSVYPNPATDYITISGAEGKQAEMFDLTGRRVMEFTVNGASCTVSVAALPAGIYMLRIDGEAVKVIK